MPSGDVRALYFPYCVKQLSKGRFIILNRNYKPLGQTSNDFVDYENHSSVSRLALTASKAAKISHDGSKSLDEIYLYDDGSVPISSKANMTAYLARLAILMSVEVKTK